MTGSCALVITTMNEIDGLRSIWASIPFELFDRVLFVDGHSTDGTLEFLADKGYEVLSQKLPGRGNAIREAIERVQEEAVLLMSSDGNDDPKYLPAISAKLAEGYDIVAGSRFTGGGRSDDGDDPIGIRRFGNRFFTILVNLLWNGRLTDSTYSLRAVRVWAWHRMKIDATRNETEYLMSIRACKLRLKIGEIPVVEGQRVGGKVKAATLPTGWSFLGLILRELFRGSTEPEMHQGSAKRVHLIFRY